MTYSVAKNNAFSEKNFLAIIEPAIIIADWIHVSGDIYYCDFTISDEFIEYVSNVTSDGSYLVLHTNSSVTSGKYFWDYYNRKLYINIGENPANKMMVVFFQIYFGTKTMNHYRNPDDINSEVVYFAPRISSATIPQIDQTDMMVFGSSSGTIYLINSDGKFYIYDNASFKNKNIIIYHVLDDLNNNKMIFKGKISDLSIDDRTLNLSYRQVDYVFNNQFNSYYASGSDPAKGFFNKTDFPNIDLTLDGYAIRTVYGCLDDVMPVNIDYAEQAAIDVNRNFVIRSDGINDHKLNYSVIAIPTSTTSRIYIGTHCLRVDDAVKIILNSIPEYSWVSAVGSNYIDVSPALSNIPSSLTSDNVLRSSIGYIKIKENNGTIYNLAFDRDFTEAIFANNTLGFILTDNFEANHPGMPIFDPKGMIIFCRIYGKKALAGNDLKFGNMTAGELILEDILTNYAGILPADININSNLFSLGLSIPDKLQTTFPTYREIIRSINTSCLGQLFFDADNKITYRLIEPMGTSSIILDDKILYSIGINFNGDDICNQVTIFWNYKENVNGSNISSHQRENMFSDKATYLHEVSKSFDIYTNLIKQSEALTIVNRYKIILEDWARIFSISAGVSLIENLVGDTIEVDRTKMLGNNTIRKMVITKIKKNLNNVELDCNDQKNIEENSGSW